MEPTKFSDTSDGKTYIGIAKQFLGSNPSTPSRDAGIHYHQAKPEMSAPSQLWETKIATKNNPRTVEQEIQERMAIATRLLCCIRAGPESDDPKNKIKGGPNSHLTIQDLTSIVCGDVGVFNVANEDWDADWDADLNCDDIRRVLEATECLCGICINPHFHS